MRTQHWAGIAGIAASLFGIASSSIPAAWSQVVKAPNYCVIPLASLDPSKPNGTAPFYPTQIQKAYGVDTLLSAGHDGAGQTIAIIDAYHYPNALDALNTFSNAAGTGLWSLPLFNQGGGGPTFSQLNQSGGTDLPGTDPAGPGNGWEHEEALDIQYAHTMAPKANIILYEANSSAFADITAAVDAARNNPAVSVISMSVGASEFLGETGLDSLFTTPSARLAAHGGVTFCAATGDWAASSLYPAFSPNVVAVGGTSLTLNSDDSYNSEAAWSLGGGGKSRYEPKPSYQNGIPLLTRRRGVPDISMDADPNTGVWVYDPYDLGSGNWWAGIGGTSLAVPLLAGLIADADQIRSEMGYGTLDGFSETLPALYSLPANDFHDVTTGNNGYAADSGYDLATGLGTPKADLLVTDLAAYRVVPEPSTLALLGIGAISLLGYAWRRRRS